MDPSTLYYFFRVAAASSTAQVNPVAIPAIINFASQATCPVNLVAAHVRSTVLRTILFFATVFCSVIALPFHKTLIKNVDKNIDSVHSLMMLLFGSP